MSDPSPSVQARRKQVLRAAGILALIVLLSSIGVYLSSSAGPAASAPQAADLKTRSYIAPGEKIDPHDAWRGVSDTRLTSMEAKLASMESENRELKRRLGAPGSQPGSQAGAQGPSKPAPDSPEQMSDADLDKRLKDYETSVERRGGYPGGTPSDPVPSRPGAAPDNGPARQQDKRQADGRPAPNRGPDPGLAHLSNGILTVRLQPAQVAPGPQSPIGRRQGQDGPTTPAGARNQERTTENYLPSGMFGRALVLSGLDAPTGGQAQSNPHPVLLQLLDLAVLPNRYRYDWKYCTVTGAGYGDISSERAYIRTESLSCVGKDGRVLDVPIKGYIAGEDGKAGMRGRLISKQGQALANALLAGVVSGIGDGLEKSSTIHSVSALGSTATVKPGDEYKAGIGAGVGRALDRLANYYIQLAEKMFPVIEVDAGRVVDVVLTKGATVDVIPNEE